MKYPAYLELHLSEIEDIVSKWPVGKTLQEVMSWILQFESCDYDIALRIIKNLNVVGPDDLNAALQIAYSKLLRHSRLKENKISTENTIFMSIGSDGKSGAMIAYNFRMINKLSSALFFSTETIELIKKGNIKNVVLVDDIIATGDQSSEQVKEKPELYELDKLIDQNVDDNKDGKSQMIECSIYVEGKTMELFFSEIAERNNYFDYNSFSVVSIGPFYSNSLVKALKMHSSVAWFVTDEPADSQTQHAQNIKSAVDDGSIVRINKIMEYFDIDKIKDSEKFRRVIDMSIFDEDMTLESRNQLLEMKLFKPQYRIENMHELMENCKNEERIKELVDTFKKP